MRSLDTQPMVRSARLDWPKGVSTLCRFGIAGVWLWAGLAKAADPSMAVLAVQAYDIVPEILVKPVAWGLPFVKLLPPDSLLQ